jgi:hypothetical protein
LKADQKFVWGEAQGVGKNQTVSYIATCVGSTAKAQGV